MSSALCEPDYMSGGGYWETLTGTIALTLKEGGIAITYPGEQKINVLLPGDFFRHPNGFPLPIPLSYWKPLKGDPAKAPLAVYLPGIFQDANIVHSYRSVQVLLQNGYQVLLIPNPLSDVYLRQFPTASPASFEKEAEVILAVLKWARQNIAYSGSLNIMGGSYGAFLGAVLAGMTAEHPEISNLISGQITLLALPINMNTTIRILDHYIDRSIAWRIGKYSADQIGDNFHGGLVNLVSWMRYHFLQRQASEIATLQYSQSVARIYESINLKRQSDLDKIKFRWIINNLEPENVAFYGQGPDYDGPKAKAGYWIERAFHAGFKRIRVLEADDDPLNDKKDYATLPLEFREPAHLLVRASGGHVGFIAQGMIDKFMTLELKPQN